MCIICRGESLTYLDLLGCTEVTRVPEVKGLTNLNCSGCINLELIEQYEDLIALNCSKTKVKYILLSPNLKFLDCSHCKFLSSILWNEKLERLICDFCILLKYIPPIDSFKVISCVGTKIFRFPKFKNLTRLNCGSCKFINELPIIDTLTHLTCDNSNIEDLSYYPNLIYLDCHNTNIKTIQPNNVLEEINCSRCYNLEFLPPIKSLKKLICKKCLFDSLPYFENLYFLDCSYCYNLVHGIQDSVKILICKYCYNLVSIPEPTELIELDCRFCTKIIPYVPEYIMNRKK
jgi:hypothetical protein